LPAPRAPEPRAVRERPERRLEPVRRAEQRGHRPLLDPELGRKRPARIAHHGTNRHTPGTVRAQIRARSAGNVTAEGGGTTPPPDGWGATDVAASAMAVRVRATG